MPPSSRLPFLPILLGAAIALAAAAPPGTQASTKASQSHYLRAILMANQGDHAGALREYEAALELDPQSSFLYQQAAELALEMGLTGKALELATRFAELAPENAAAHFLLGNVRWARGEPALGKLAFEKALALKPDYREALFALGNLLAAQSPEAAKKYLEDYLASNPENAAEGEYQLALIEQRAGRLEEAARRLQGAIRRDPDNMQARYNLAQLYEVRRDTDAALAAYGEILERDPKNVQLLTHVGELHFGKGEPEASRGRFLQAKSLSPGNPAACLWLAILAEQDKDYDGAVAALRDSSALKDDAAVNLRLSYYLTQANRLKEAVEVLDAAHRRWPDHEDVAYFLALGYDDLKDTAKAVSLMRKVVAARPDHRDARFQLGALYERGGRVAEAEEQFRELLRANPSDASALNYLGYSLADRGLKLEEAEGLVRRAVELDPDNGAYRDSLGWAHFKLGRHREALRELEGASKLLPYDDTVWEHVGDAREASGDAAGAWEAWKSAAALVPERPGLAKKLESAERALPPEELGSRYQAFLLRSRGELESFGGPCEIEGSAGRKAFRFAGLLHFRAPHDLSVEAFGPMFAPLFRLALVGEGGFEMDPLRVEGVEPEALREALYASLQVLRDYLRGSVFRQPAVHKRGWRGAWLETAGWRLSLDKAGRLASLQSGDGTSLSLEDYRSYAGRWLPAALSLGSKGLEVRFKLAVPTARFSD